MNRNEIFDKLIREAETTKKRIFYKAVYLFSSKGYSNVGIRELCRSINIKESSFYNHYAGKEELLSEILKYFIEISSKTVFSAEDIERIIDSGNIEKYLRANMKVYAEILGDPLYSTLLRFIMMESYTNFAAYNLVKTNYSEPTEKILMKMIDNGFIRKMDVKTFTSSYYYAVSGMVQEYLIREAWDENEGAEEINKKFEKNIDLFLNILKNSG